MVIDIDENVKHSMLGSYADDTRLWKIIYGEEDRDLLQKDLEALYRWADHNNKTFNDDKFEYLPFGTPNPRSYTSPLGETIKTQEHVKDLGVYMSGTCSFNYHIASLVKAASQVSAWILRTFLSREKNLMKTLMKSLLVPKCEYASVVWSPFDKKNIALIENIQRRFTSKIRDYQTFDEEHQRWICSVNYVDRLKDLKIYSLVRRRERVMILYAYRVLIGLLEFQWFEAYEDFPGSGIKLKPKYNSRARNIVKRCRHSSFFYKGAQLYNLIPVELRQVEEIIVPNQGHVNTFKEKLDKFLEEIPDEPSVADLPRNAATNSLICQIPVFLRQQNVGPQ